MYAYRIFFPIMSTYLKKNERHMYKYRFIYKHTIFEIYKFANHYSLSYTIILYMFLYI